MGDLGGSLPAVASERCFQTLGDRQVSPPPLAGWDPGVEDLAQFGMVEAVGLAFVVQQPGLGREPHESVELIVVVAGHRLQRGQGLAVAKHGRPGQQLLTVAGDPLEASGEFGVEVQGDRRQAHVLAGSGGSRRQRSFRRRSGGRAATGAASGLPRLALEIE